MFNRLSLNAKLKLLLAVWAVAYPVVACGPAYITHGGVSGFIGNALSTLLGGILLVPWLLGLLVLGTLAWLTSSRRRDR